MFKIISLIGRASGLRLNRTKDGGVSIQFVQSYVNFALILCIIIAITYITIFSKRYLYMRIIEVYDHVLISPVSGAIMRKEFDLILIEDMQNAVNICFKFNEKSYFYEMGYRVRSECNVIENFWIENK